MSAMIKLFLGPLKKWTYSDFVQETAKPTRRAWVRIREAHMESLIKGVDWMEKKSREMPFSSYVLCSKSKYDEQGNSRKSFLNLLAELKNRLKISIFLWRKSCASR